MLNAGNAEFASSLFFLSLRRFPVEKWDTIAQIMGPRYALERAFEAMWIAGGLARKGLWEYVVNTVVTSVILYEMPEESEARLYIDVLWWAGQTQSETSENAKSLLRVEILDKIKVNMAVAMSYEASKLVKDGDYDNAHEICMIALDADPNNADAHFLLGSIAVEQDNHSEAIRELEIAARYGIEQASELLRLLRNMR